MSTLQQIATELQEVSSSFRIVDGLLLIPLEHLNDTMIITEIDDAIELRRAVPQTFKRVALDNVKSTFCQLITA